jgi:hypothetical protein
MARRRRWGFRQAKQLIRVSIEELYLILKVEDAKTSWRSSFVAARHLHSWAYEVRWNKVAPCHPPFWSTTDDTPVA